MTKKNAALRPGETHTQAGTRGVTEGYSMEWGVYLGADGDEARIGLFHRQQVVQGIAAVEGALVIGNHIGQPAAATIVEKLHHIGQHILGNASPRKPSVFT